MWLKRLLIGSALLSAGCGRPGVPARFSGRTEAPIATASEVRETPVRLAGYRSLGRLSSSCTGSQRTRELQAVWLKDVGCSEELLTRALFERAAEVGGELLAERKCEAKEKRKRRVRRTCSAWVLRSTHTRAAAGRIREVAGPPRTDVMPASDAWRIRVSLRPAGPHEAARAPRPLHRVDETAVVSLADVPFGDVTAQCEGACARQSVYDAIRLAAARVGARSVWGVDCLETAPGWFCAGHAGVYATDPKTHPDAR